MQSFKRKSICLKQADKKSKLTIEQTLDLFVNNVNLSDVCFYVGDKKIYAHRLILAMSNSEFQRMFYSVDEETADEVLVLDCSYNGLLNVFRYLYTKRVQLDPSEICETFLAAKKYKEFALIEELANLITKRWLTSSNAAVLYDQLLKLPIDDPLLKEVRPLIEKCFTSLRRMIELNSLDVFQSESFKLITQNGLVSLLKFPQLNISEFEILRACFGWVDEELRRREQELNKANQVMLFREIKGLIRFGDLDFEDLGRIEIDNYLTIDEIGSVLLHLTNRSKPLGIEYESPREVFRNFRYSVLASTDGVMSANYSTRDVTFQLSVNKRVFLESIEMQPLSVSDAIFFQISVDGRKIELGPNFSFQKETTTWSIFFEEKRLELSPLMNYKLDLKFTIPYQGRSINFYHSKLSFSKQLILKNEESEVTFDIFPGFGYHCIKAINFYLAN